MNYLRGLCHQGAKLEEQPCSRKIKKTKLTYLAPSEKTTNRSNRPKIVLNVSVTY